MLSSEQLDDDVHSEGAIVRMFAVFPLQTVKNLQGF